MFVIMFIFASMQVEEQDFLYESIGNQIRKLRKKSRFSQDQLAKRLNLSRASIVNIEKGRQHPSLHLLVELSRVLNTSISTFLNDDMFKDFSNKSKLSQIKKKISKASDDADQEKIMEFIKQTLQS
jgi:transcriptional regulator with XRE-family HTH domain